MVDASALPIAKTLEMTSMTGRIANASLPAAVCSLISKLRARCCPWLAMIFSSSQRRFAGRHPMPISKRERRSALCRSPGEREGRGSSLCADFCGSEWEQGGGILFSDSEQNFTPAAGVCQVTYDTGVRDNARLERADTPGYRPAEFQLRRDLPDDTDARCAASV